MIKKSWQYLMMILVPVSLTFSFLMALSYFKSNYPTVKSQYESALTHLNLGSKAQADTKVYTVKINPIKKSLKYSLVKNPYSEVKREMSKENKKKITKYENPILLEDVK